MRFGFDITRLLIIISPKPENANNSRTKALLRLDNMKAFPNLHSAKA